MSKKKIAVVLAATALAASLIIGGTLAYLTDSDKKTNTFTMGNIDISLAEPNWDDTTDGKGLVPGDTLVKDPTVTAAAGNSYMRVKVEFYDTSAATPVLITDSLRIAKILSTLYTDPTYNPATAVPTLGTNIVEGTGYTAASLASYAGVNKTDFTYDTTRTASAGIRYYNYTVDGGVFKAGTSPKTVLFTNVVIPTDFKSADIALLGSYSITLTAEAIQTDGFANASAAFTALDAG